MWCVKLSDSQRDAVRALIKAQGELGPSLGAALEALDYARWDDLPDAQLPWDRVARARDGPGHRRGRRGLGPDRGHAVRARSRRSKPRPKGAAARRAAKSARRPLA